MASTIGSRLRTLRKAQGLLQRDAAKAVGVAVSSYALYENDRRKPNPEIMQKLCEFYHCDANYLYGYSEAMSQSDIALAQTKTIMLFDLDDIGNGSVNVSDSHASFALPRDILNSMRFYFGVRVADDSMLGSSLRRGDYAVFTVDSSLDTRKPCIISFNGKAMIRYIELNHDGQIAKLVPANDLFNPTTVRDTDTVSVIGHLAAVVSNRE